MMNLLQSRESMIKTTKVYTNESGRDNSTRRLRKRSQTSSIVLSDHPLANKEILKDETNKQRGEDNLRETLSISSPPSAYKLLKHRYESLKT